MLFMSLKQEKNYYYTIAAEPERFSTSVRELGTLRCRLLWTDRDPLRNLLPIESDPLIVRQ